MPLLLTCPTCGLAYDDFRAGMDFRTARAALWSYDPDPTTWKYKRRHTVLGVLRENKQMFWSAHIQECKEAKLAAPKQDREPGEDG